jgi:hypothetical protein
MCRCPEQPLATYYARADEVLIGELVEVEARGTDYLLEVLIQDRPWKVAETRDIAVRAGDTLRYVTSASSSECGLELRVGLPYLIFAPTTASAEELPRIHSCDGTRFVSEGGDDRGRGFVDVPGPFVASQLDALSGLEFLARATPDVPDESDPANAALVGLLDIPAFEHGGWIFVRGRPDMEAPVLARAESYGDLEAREVAYEVGAAVVLTRLQGWYRVRLADGRTGWISPEEAGTWFPYAELPIRRLAYLTGAWSGHVWPEPGAGTPARSSRKGSLDEEEYAVEVLEATDVGGTTWFRIEVLNENPCDGGEVRPELGGWVPAHGVGGMPLIWYYSRGC